MDTCSTVVSGEHSCSKTSAIIAMDYVSTHIRGLSEKLERVCTSLGVRAAFKPVRTLKQTLMRLKTRIPEERKRGVVYKVPCKECSKTYVGETKRTLKVRLLEHKQAVKRGDHRNGIAIYTCSQDPT